MRKLVLSFVVMFSSVVAYSQVGIGTLTPDQNAQLEVKAEDKGILIPRVRLTSLTDRGPIRSASPVPNSLLVFNLTTNAELKPGYYYWLVDRWQRVATEQEVRDINTTNQRLFFEDGANGEKTLVLTDSDGNRVAVGMKEIIESLETLTTLSYKDGVLVYVDEDKGTTSIPLKAGDIPFTTIDSTPNADGTPGTNGVNAKTIQEAITLLNQKITEIQGTKGDLTGDKIIEVKNGAKSVLHDVALSIKDGSITADKIADGTITSDKINPKAIKNLETLTVLSYNNSILSYKDEAGNITNIPFDAGNITFVTPPADGNNGGAGNNGAGGTGTDGNNGGAGNNGAGGTGTDGNNGGVGNNGAGGNNGGAGNNGNNSNPKTIRDIITTIQNEIKEIQGTKGTLSVADFMKITHGELNEETTALADAVLKNLTISVKVASSENLGVVKQAKENPTVQISEDGVLSVNTTNITDGLDGGGITTENVVINNNDGTKTTIKKLKVDAENGIQVDEKDNKLKLGGDLTKVTKITTSKDNTLSIDGLQDADKENDLLVMQTADGVLRKHNTAEVVKQHETLTELTYQDGTLTYQRERDNNNVISLNAGNIPFNTGNTGNNSGGTGTDGNNGGTGGAGNNGAGGTDGANGNAGNNGGTAGNPQTIKDVITNITNQITQINATKGTLSVDDYMEISHTEEGKEKKSTELSEAVLKDLKLSVKVASDKNLGVVKQATENPTVEISKDGVLSVNTTNITDGLDGGGLEVEEGKDGKKKLKIKAKNGVNVGDDDYLKLGGALTETATEIKTAADKTLAITGLQTGNVTDSLVVLKPNGILQKNAPDTVIKHHETKTSLTYDKAKGVLTYNAENQVYTANIDAGNIPFIEDNNNGGTNGTGGTGSGSGTDGSSGNAGTGGTDGSDGTAGAGGTNGNDGGAGTQGGSQPKTIKEIIKEIRTEITDIQGTKGTLSVTGPIQMKAGETATENVASLKDAVLKDVVLSVQTATADNLGVVKQAKDKPTVEISSEGVLSVNTTNITDGLNGGGLTIEEVTNNNTTGGTTTTKKLKVNAKNGINVGTDGFVKLGGGLTEVTEITTSATNTLAIKDLQKAKENEKDVFVVQDATSGVLRQRELNAANIPFVKKPSTGNNGNAGTPGAGGADGTPGAGGASGTDGNNGADGSTGVAGTDGLDAENVQDALDKLNEKINEVNTKAKGGTLTVGKSLTLKNGDKDITPDAQTGKSKLDEVTLKPVEISISTEGLAGNGLDGSTPGVLTIKTPDTDNKKVSGLNVSNEGIKVVAGDGISVTDKVSVNAGDGLMFSTETPAEGDTKKLLVKAKENAGVKVTNAGVEVLAGNGLQIDPTASTEQKPNKGVILGGDLDRQTEIKATAVNTLAISGLETAKNNEVDVFVVQDATTSVLRKRTLDAANIPLAKPDNTAGAGNGNAGAGTGDSGAGTGSGTGTDGSTGNAGANGNNGLTATNVQDAINELNTKINEKVGEINSRKGKLTTNQAIQINSEALKEGKYELADALLKDATLTVKAGNGLAVDTNADSKGVILGGALDRATEITTTTANTLAIKGLDDGAKDDVMVVQNATSGILKKRVLSATNVPFTPNKTAPNTGTEAGQGGDTTNNNTQNDGIAADNVQGAIDELNTKINDKIKAINDKVAQGSVTVNGPLTIKDVEAKNGKSVKENVTLAPIEISISNANGTTAGIVKQAKDNPTVTISQDGELSVNTTNIRNNLSTDLAGEGLVTNANGYALDVQAGDGIAVDGDRVKADLGEGLKFDGGAEHSKKITLDLQDKSGLAIVGGTGTDKGKLRILEGKGIHFRDTDGALEVSASQGLTQTDDGVKLGGKLTEERELNVNSQNFKISNLPTANDKHTKVLMLDDQNVLSNKELTAANVPFTQTEGTQNPIGATNVKEAIEKLNEKIVTNTTNLTKGNLTSTDITVSDGNGGDGTNALFKNVTLAIASGAVTSDKIKDGTIVEGDLADNAVTENKIKNDAVTTNKIKDEAVTEGKLATDAVTTNKIKDEAVTEGKLATDAVTTNKIKDEAVTEGKLANNAVTENKISNDAVTENKIKDGAVTENKLVTDAVTTNKIKNGAVTSDKIAEGAVTAGKIGGKKAITATGPIKVNNTTSVADAILADVAISVDTANGTNLGVVKEAGSNATVKINAQGELSVDTSAITSGLAGGGLTTETTTPAGTTPAVTKLKVNAKNGINVGNDNFVKLGGELTEATTITTAEGKTLAITGLADGAKTDNLIVQGTDGILKKLSISSAVSESETLTSLSYASDSGTLTYNAENKQATNIDLKAGTTFGVVKQSTEKNAPVTISNGVIDVKKANGKDQAGIVIEAETNPTVTITNGVLAVNTDNIKETLATDLAGAGLVKNGSVLDVQAGNGILVADDRVKADLGDGLKFDGGEEHSKKITLNIQDGTGLAIIQSTGTDNGKLRVLEGQGVKFDKDGAISLIAENGLGATADGVKLGGTLDDATTTINVNNKKLQFTNLPQVTTDHTKVLVVNGSGDLSERVLNADNIPFTASQGADIQATNVKAAIEELKTKLSTTDGKITKSDITGTNGISVTGGTNAVLNAVTLTLDANAIGNGSIDPSKIKDRASITKKAGDDNAIEIEGGNNAVLAATSIGVRKANGATSGVVKTSGNADDPIQIADGVISLKAGSITKETIKDRGNITGGTGITVNGGDGATFTNVTISIDGNTIANQITNNTISPDKISGKQNLQGDGTITIEGGQNAVLATTKVKVATANGTTLGVVKQATENPEINVNNGILTIADNAVTSTKIKDGAVTETKLGANAVTSEKIKDGTIAEADLGADSVTSAKIKDGTIASTDLGNNAVTTEKINNGAVTTDKLGASAVTSEKIADNAVTAAKISGKANITGQNGINVTGGDNAVLNGVTLSLDANTIVNNITNNSIDPAKIKDKAAMTGTAPVKINGKASETDVVLKAVTISVDNANGTSAGIVKQKSGDAIVTINAQGELDVDKTKLTPNLVSNTGGITTNTDGTLKVNADSGVEVDGGVVKLGGTLKRATTITTDATNTLTLAGLQPGGNTDTRVLVTDNNGKVAYKEATAIGRVYTAENGVQINNSNVISAVAKNNGAIDVNGGISVKRGNGIETTGDNIAVKPKTNGGILVTADGVAVNKGNGLDTTLDAVVVKAKDKGGIQVTSAGVEVLADSGVQVDTSVGKVRLGGSLERATTITTSSANTLTLAGLQPGGNDDARVLVTNAAGKVTYKNATDIGKIYEGKNGIVINNTDVSADIDTNKALEFTGTTEGSKKIGIKVKSNGAISATSDGLAVNVIHTSNNNKPKGIKITNNALEVFEGQGLRFGTDGSLAAHLHNGLVFGNGNDSDKITLRLGKALNWSTSGTDGQKSFDVQVQNGLYIPQNAGTNQNNNYIRLGGNLIENTTIDFQTYNLTLRSVGEDSATSNTAENNLPRVMVLNTDNNVKTLKIAGVTNDKKIIGMNPWNKHNTTNPSGVVTEDIYHTGKVGIGSNNNWTSVGAQLHIKGGGTSQLRLDNNQPWDISQENHTPNGENTSAITFTSRGTKNGRVFSLTEQGEVYIGSVTSPLSTPRGGGNVQLNVPVTMVGGEAGKGTGVSNNSDRANSIVAKGTAKLEGMTDMPISETYVVADAKGVLGKAKRRKNQFYMPSVVLPTTPNAVGSGNTTLPQTSHNNGTYTVNLHALYKEQFKGNLRYNNKPAYVSSAGSSGLEVYENATELEYYVVYYDTTVFENVTINANGVLTYTVIANARVTERTFMNIVFQEKW